MNINNVEDLIGTYMLSNMMKKATESSESSSMAFDIMMESLLNSISKTENETSTSSNKSFSTPSNIKLDNININWNFKGTSQGISNIISSNSISNIGELDINENDSEKDRIFKALDYYADKYGVDKKLVRAIAKQESNFNSKVVSSAGAIGVMQLMPATAKYLGVSDPYNIEQNIEGGVKYIKQQLDKYGDVDLALMAYNAGPGTVQQRGVTSSEDIYKMPKETQNYVKKVKEYYNKL